MTGVRPRENEITPAGAVELEENVLDAVAGGDAIADKLAAEKLQDYLAQQKLDDFKRKFLS